MTDQILYNKIGRGYNTTRKADPFISGRLYALLAPETGKNYLDIGCGTGNYTILLAEFGIAMTGVDPSELMLKEAKKKSDDITWIQGTAEKLPLPDGSMDGGIATLTVHHWKEHQRAFSELYRVLKPGARFILFTFTPEQEKGYWFNHYFPEMMQRGMKRSLTLEQINTIVKDAGLTIVQTEKYYVQYDLEDMFGYSGKHDPERYFDPEIVNGISYFSIYADESEKDSGFKKLRADIDSGKFAAIQQEYENDLGDYLFVALKK